MATAQREVFEESEISYWFMANSAKDQDEWSTAISSGRYTHTRSKQDNLFLCFSFIISGMFVLPSMYIVHNVAMNTCGWPSVS